MTDIEKVARYFSALVRAEFDTETLAEIVATNAASDNHTCATQDYIDANCLMYGAFCAHFFREPDVSSDADTDIWNQAWNMAKKAQFQN